MRFLKTCIFTAIALTAVIAKPCAVLLPDGANYSVKDEKSVIFFSSAEGVQHFIRKITFDSTSENLGYLIPVQNEPTVEKADASTVDAALELAKKFEKSQRATKNTEAVDAAAGEAGVLSEQQVGSFTATILMPRDEEAFTAWLTENGFAANEAVQEWMRPYLRGQFHFVALKLNKAPDASDGMITEAIRITSNNIRAFYPYREPVGLAASGEYEFATVLIADQKQSLILSNSGLTQYAAGWVSDADMASLSKQAGITMPEGKYYLTAFSGVFTGGDRTNSEMYFEQEKLKAPVPMMEKIKGQMNPMYMVGGGLLVLALLLKLFVKPKPKAEVPEVTEEQGESSSSE